MRIWANERILRLFRTARARLRTTAQAVQAEVHEAWSVDGPVGDLDGTLEHFSYPTMSAYRSKFDTYTDLEARAARSTSSQATAQSFWAVPRFLWLLFARGGIQDGWRGIYVSFWSAWYAATVAWKAAHR